MDNYCIISIGGKQYQVTEGQLLEVQKLEVEEGKDLIFDQVLLHRAGDKVTIGTPTIKDLKVFASFVDEKKGEKIQVFKYKSKSRYRKMKGARQTLTTLKILSIGNKPPQEPKPVVKKATPKPKKVVAKKSVSKTK